MDLPRWLSPKTMVAIERAGIRRMSAVELREGVRPPQPDRSNGWARVRVIGLFLLVGLGIVVSFYWGPAWAFERDPSKGFDFGWPGIFLVRCGLSLIIAFVTFVPIYTKIGKSTSESWAPFVLAFQNGFAWQSLFEGIVKPPS